MHKTSKNTKKITKYPRKKWFFLVALFFIIIIIIKFNYTSKTPLLKEWVEKRGHTYYSDYSTLNILGYELYNGKLRSNPYLSVKSKYGDIPDVSQKKILSLKIDGKADIEHFFKSARVNIIGNFEASTRAEMTLEKPFKQVVSAFVPNSSCDSRELSIVTSVLNTGEMRVKIKDEKNNDITAKFKLKLIDENAETTIKDSGGETIIISGKGLYIGYVTELKKCIKVNEKEIILKKAEEYNDDEIGIYGLYFQNIKKGYMEKAVIYLNPSKLSVKEGERILEQTAFKQMASIQKDGVAAKVANNIPSENRFTESTSYEVIYGDRFGIPKIPRMSGLYIEVESVNEKEVKLKVQHIRYEDVK